MKLKVGDKVEIFPNGALLISHMGEIGTIIEMFRWYDADCAIVKFADDNEHDFNVCYLKKV